MQYAEAGEYPASSVRVCSNVGAGAIRGLKFREESNLLYGFPLLPDVTVCDCESLFVHVTVLPTWA